MQAEIQGNNLVITIPLSGKVDGKYPLSATGKTRSVASTHGNLATNVIVEGKPVVVGLNAYIKAN